VLFRSAMLNNVSGIQNTAAGVNALLTNTTGNSNTALGFNADVTIGTLTNATALGYGAKATASNMIRIGNAQVTNLEAQVPFTTTSDRRLKHHIADLPLGLDFILSLRPVEYLRNAATAPAKEWGLIAQELQQSLAKAGYKDAGLVSEDASADKMMTVRYNDLLAPMIKATQQQQELIRSQQATIQEQQQINRQQDLTIAALLKRIEALEHR
jgi:hypothetical protein